LSKPLTTLQQKLCNILQDGLPLCSRPFHKVACYLGSDEKTILQQIRELKNLGIIRRISASVNYRALGLTGTLVAAHVPVQQLREVIEAVNSLQNVSHNYRRNHYYNLWFTLQMHSTEQIRLTLSNLSTRFGIDFHSLPVVRIFKLDVRFDATGEAGILPPANPEVIENQYKTRIVPLERTEKLILSELQGDLKLTSTPFIFLCREGLDEQKALQTIKQLIHKGVIRRIGAVVDHRKLGFVTNILFIAQVSMDRIIEAGRRLASSTAVSHCYQRKTFADWPYNLYAMMHGRSRGEIQHVINKFVESEGIDSFELLPTTDELKKQPLKYHTLTDPDTRDTDSI